MLRSILSILVMSSALGCATGCLKKAPQFKTQIRKVWSIEFGCGCQLYDLNNVVKLTDMDDCVLFYEKYFPKAPVKENALHCDDLIGFDFDKVATEITPKGKEINRWAEDRCK